MESSREAPPRTEVVGGCPACGMPGGRPFFHSEDRLLGTPGTFHYRRCTSCATVYQDPRVVRDDLPRLYTGDYYTRASIEAGPTPADTPDTRPWGGGFRGAVRDAIRDAVAPEPLRPGPAGWGRLLALSRWLRVRAFGDHVVDELLPWRRPAGRALDVGCGSGKLMLQLARVGWAVEGAEWDAASVGRAHAHTGFPVHQGDAETLPQGLGPFDLIVLSHVLEHLPRPVEALAALRRLLAPRGRLVVIVPNPESLTARWFGRYWYHWDAPRHMVLVPPGMMAHVGRRAGFGLLRSRTMGRWAAAAWGTSRARRDGDPIPEVPGAPDRLWAGLEALLLALGAPVGEEIVAVFAPRVGTRTRREGTR